MQELANCQLCPHRCGVNRLQGCLGVCLAGPKLKVALASPHFGEEPCISGTNGSGTIFFSDCNMHCVFCQNYTISQEKFGHYITVDRLCEIILELQALDVHNINLVTPTHYVPHIKKALYEAKQKGLTIPVIYNTNSFDLVETINSLNGYIDIYLPDFKYFDDSYARRYSVATSYYNYAITAIEEMLKQVGKPVFDSAGIMQRGVIIRHLALPGLSEDSKNILQTIKANFGNDVYISLMNQYTPLYNSSNYPEINRKLSNFEIDEFI